MAASPEPAGAAAVAAAAAAAAASRRRRQAEPPDGRCEPGAAGEVPAGPRRSATNDGNDGCSESNADRPRASQLASLLHGVVAQTQSSMEELMRNVSAAELVAAEITTAMEQAKDEAHDRRARLELERDGFRVAAMQSRLFALGNTTIRTPLRLAAIVFSFTWHTDVKHELASHQELTPPMGRTRPVRVTSPVMARSFFTSLFMAKDSIEVIMVHPALGPSLGVAPAGTRLQVTTRDMHLLISNVTDQANDFHTVQQGTRDALDHMLDSDTERLAVNLQTTMAHEEDLRTFTIQGAHHIGHLHAFQQTAGQCESP
eukprot:SM000047S16872  [mRNA]  locus=s47:460695:468365:- [translate_table: standard]